MNCYIHIDRPAVATCPQCGIGLCKKCIDNAVYTLENRPLCHNCSLELADKELSDARSRKIWSLVKMIFGASFMVLGISIYCSTGDIMNGWIYAGIAGIPAAFKSTRTSRRQKMRNELDDALAPGMTDLAANWMIRLLVKVALIIFLAPIMATFSVFKNLFVFIGSFSDVKKAQLAYDYLASEEDIATEDANAGQRSDAGWLPEVEASIPATRPAAVEDDLPIASPPQTSRVVAGRDSVQAPVLPARSRGSSVVVMSVLAGILLIGGGALAYFLWYVPYARDRDAPRTYVVANNVFLRSSQMAGIEYNILGKIPYGSEVITYSYNSTGDWAEVKVNGKEGFMASGYLIDAESFTLLNNIWGDLDTKECIESAKCRLAILDCFKVNHLASGPNDWQVFTRPLNQKPNTIFYPRLYNKYSKYTDFVFIVKNNTTGARALVCYSFDDVTEKPIFRFSAEAPRTGYIKNIVPRSGGAKVIFDNNQSSNISF